MAFRKRKPEKEKKIPTHHLAASKTDIPPN
jgi:hypothetical protein